jgi:tripartite-type tricarboxylate transporter receptor subunit TctC
VLPNVPTTLEAGISGYEAYGWFAMLAPRGTPRAVVDRLHATYEKALADPDIRRRIVEVGAEPATSTPAQLGTFMAEEAKKWGEIIKAHDIKPN